MTIFRNTLLFLSLAGLGASLLALSALVFLPQLSRLFRRWISLGIARAALIGLFVLGFIQYGATKSKFSYDGGIKATTPHSYSTNDEVHVTWARDISHGVYVPDSATVYIDYRLSSNTNGEWGLLSQAIVGDWRWDGELADATNYDYNVWAYYIPPEPVHTNGVWVYKTFKDRSDVNPIPLRARIEINGKAIATPKEKRKDEYK